MMLNVVLVNEVRNSGWRRVRGIPSSINRAIHEELNLLLQCFIDESFSLRLLLCSVSNCDLFNKMKNQSKALGRNWQEVKIYLNTIDSPNRRLSHFTCTLEKGCGVIQIALNQFDVWWQFYQILCRWRLNIARDSQNFQWRFSGNKASDQGAALLSRCTSD